mmetsp:Transcript_105851/g.199337  ORF Transcript_105851/g.199337 Transcript_105851/m.199337 type:complete len:514 (-) Transcript_105851:179-1720(-)
MSNANDNPWLEYFLTPSEKDHFAGWKEVLRDRSVINPMMEPVFDFFSRLVPDNVAPNVLTLSGAFAIIQAWYFCFLFFDSDPTLVCAVSAASILVFWLAGGIDGKHAARTMNDTSFGALFKYVSDLISSVFLVIVLCELLSSEKNLVDQWYCVQTAQLVLLLKHYSAFMREAGLRFIWIGPGEMVAWVIGVLVISGFLGLGWLKALYSYTWGVCCNHLVDTMNLDPQGYFATMAPARATYISVFVLALCRIASSVSYKRHTWTRNSLLLILGLRALNFITRIVISAVGKTTERDVIFDGLFMAMTTSDLIVSKMANRELHSYVVVMASMVVLPHLQFLIICFVVFYWITVFGDLMHHLNIPLLQVCRNVYCDGIYDLCHVGHKNLFRRALKHGNRLLVGVVGDADANAYKRPPIMTAAERESEVANCKCVTKVIPNAPCFGMTMEFIQQHRIHVVAFGQEYLDRFPNPDDDPYYKVPRKLGIATPMPRTNDISTSDLIKRIQDRGKDDKKSPT